MERTSRVRRLLLAFCAAILASVTGCATLDLREPEKDNVSLVFGYLDMSEAPGDLQWIDLKQLRPVTDKPYYHCAVEDGMFWNQYIPSGSFKVSDFGGMSGLDLGILYLFGSEVEYSFGNQGRGKMDPVIERPGLYYVGSYRVKITKRGFFTNSEYDIEPLESPSEKELLERLLVHAKDTSWRERILARLEELK